MNGVSRFVAAASLAVGALLSASCNDGLLHAPAPAQSARLTVSASFGQNAGGASAAYDRADRVFLRFRVGDDVRLEQEVPFSPAGAQTSVRIDVPLRQLSETVNAELELRSAGRPLFRGNASLALTAGGSTPVEFTLDPVVASVACGTGLLQMNAYGQTASLGGAALFATGDTVRDVPVTWSVAQNLAVSVSDAGQATALQDGDAIATCTAQGLNATRSIRVFAIVSSIKVSPALGILVVGNTLPLTATLFDSRGNAILTQRPLTWSSGSTSIATVNATGVVTGVIAGAAKITARSDTVSGTADLTIVLTSTAVTNAAINISGTGATLLGTVNPRGSATQGYFEYGTDPTLANPSVTPGKSAGSGTADVALNETISGLTPGVTYYFRAVSNGVGGISRGSIVSFVTPRLPSVTTSSVSILGLLIVAGGTATPNGSPATAWFRYGTNSTLSTFSETIHRSIGSGESPFQLAEVLTGLSQYTTYYVRAVATNTGGTALGGIVSFTTGGQPTIVSYSGVYGGCAYTKFQACAALYSSTNPNGMPTEVWFEYGSTQSFTSYTESPHQSIGSGTAAVSATYGVLFPFGGTVWYRVAARNAMGTVRTTPVVQPTLPPIG